MERFAPAWRGLTPPLEVVTTPRGPRVHTTCTLIIRMHQMNRVVVKLRLRAQLVFLGCLQASRVQRLMLTKPGVVYVTFLSRFYVGNFVHADTATSDSRPSVDCDSVLGHEVGNYSLLNYMNALHESTAHKSSSLET